MTTQQQDRELLELAAKAAGLSHDGYSNHVSCDMYDPRDGDPGLEISFDVQQKSQLCDNSGVWNPLRDDGDALRLAVSLLIQVVQDRMGFVKVGWSVGFDSGTPSMDGRGPWYLKEWLSDHSGDRQAATRRAIVRAAAAIGRAAP